MFDYGCVAWYVWQGGSSKQGPFSRQFTVRCTAPPVWLRMKWGRAHTTLQGSMVRHSPSRFLQRTGGKLPHAEAPLTGKEGGGEWSDSELVDVGAEILLQHIINRKRVLMTTSSSSGLASFSFTHTHALSRLPYSSARTASIAAQTAPCKAKGDYRVLLGGFELLRLASLSLDVTVLKGLKRAISDKARHPTYLVVRSKEKGRRKNPAVAISSVAAAIRPVAARDAMRSPSYLRPASGYAPVMEEDPQVKRLKQTPT
ncbi:hypothetical protein C0Q70_00756 [Pomacea canaliculata]|uniref:Uncharacterized protein n=1 Tax=Pomacea canaliculata TaxID=400727 RepID=A0A2T7PXJ0_POMCA|nr:hypothetical protein C0Q70_00756 [Pomacea canaliculata]